MASATYTDLRTNAAAWAQRSDLSSILPDCVVLAEKKINRSLRDMNMEATSTTTPLTETTALPTDFVELNEIVISYSGIRTVPTYVTPAAMDTMRTTTTTVTGDPCYFTIRKGYIEVFPAPSSATTYTMTLTYILRVVPLATTATNWLLTDHFDVYLYATLAEVAAYAHNDAEEGKWRALYDQALTGITRYNDRRKFKKPIRVALGLPGTQVSGDITTPY